MKKQIAPSYKRSFFSDFVLAVPLRKRVYLHKVEFRCAPARIDY
jgi:hypothetical protein